MRVRRPAAVVDFELAFYPSRCRALCPSFVFHILSNALLFDTTSLCPKIIIEMVMYAMVLRAARHNFHGEDVACQTDVAVCVRGGVCVCGSACAC